MDPFLAGCFFGGFALASLAGLAYWLHTDGFEDGTIEH